MLNVSIPMKVFLFVDVKSVYRLKEEKNNRSTGTQAATKNILEFYSDFLLEIKTKILPLERNTMRSRFIGVRVLFATKITI